MNILIIDQFPSTGRGIESMLAHDRPDWHVLEQAFTAEAGRRKTETYRPDVILMEPVLFGRAPENLVFQLSEFRKLSPDSKLVAVTASCDPEHIRAALKSGFFDYLYKPVSRPDLLSVLDRCTDPDTAHRGEALFQMEDALVEEVHRGNTERALDLLSQISAGQSRLTESYSHWCVQYMDIATRILHLPDEVTQAPESLSILYQDFILYVSRHNHFDDLDRAMTDFVRQSADAFGHHSRGQSHQIIRQAVRIVEAHLDEELSLSRMAEELYISTTYFSRLFKAKTGKKFSEYLAEQRIERAKALLAVTDDPVCEIARQVGYQEANSFARLFKTYTGMTPSRYRKESKETRSAPEIR